MFRWAVFLGLLGLAAATGIIVWSGWSEVLQALSEVGWGVLFIALFHGISLTLSSASWRVLIPSKRAPSLLLFIYYMWVRAAINNLMPVARIGGEIAAIRLMTAHKMKKSVAIASTVVELTVSIAAVFVFVVIGVILFAWRINDQDIVRQFIWGLVLSMPLILALALIQRIGLFVLLSRLFDLIFRDKWTAMMGNAVRNDRMVSLIYRRKLRIILCFLMQIIAWGLGSVEIWFSLIFLHRPLPLCECIMIEALIQGSASAAFAVPGALGIQEAGFLIIGGMLGLPHEIAAALAVMRRGRDLLFYAPALVIWQAHEGKKFFVR